MDKISSALESFGVIKSENEMIGRENVRGLSDDYSIERRDFLYEDKRVPASAWKAFHGRGTLICRKQRRPARLYLLVAPPT